MVRSESVHSSTVRPREVQSNQFPGFISRSGSPCSAASRSVATGTRTSGGRFALVITCIALVALTSTHVLLSSVCTSPEELRSRGVQPCCLERESRGLFRYMIRLCLPCCLFAFVRLSRQRRCCALLSLILEHYLRTAKPVPEEG